MSLSAKSLYHISVLIDQMKSQDIRYRLNSMGSLSTIAKALGPERTRKELIPFLSEDIDDDDEEILLTMIKQLGMFLPHVGGVKYASVLLPPLENLCTTEETSIRDKAVELLCKIGPKMSESDLIESFIPMLKRLNAGLWFSDRISSCGLFHIAYPRVPEPLRNELRTMYRKLCHDDMPEVRKAAAMNLGKFIVTIEQPHLKNDIMSMFKDLGKDDQDCVRLFAVKSCVDFGKQLEPPVPELVPVIVKFAQDKYWRVRCMVANQLLDLCQTVGPDATRTDMVSVYARLARDNEVEVRTTVARKITMFCQILSPEITVQHILPYVKALSSDSSRFVRTALSIDIVGLAPILEKDATIEHLLPTLQTLLKDSFSEVRLNIMNKLDQMKQVIGIDVLSQTLLSVIVELTEVKHSYSIRHAMIEYIPMMASELGVGIYNDVLRALCIQWLKDKVCVIREAAVQNLKRLAEIFGKEWALEHIIPQVLNVVNDKYALYRKSILDALLNLAPVMGSKITCSQILPVILAASKDRVPNVRFHVAKALKSLASVVDRPAVLKSILPCLHELKEDKDPDVEYFAKEALQAINQVKGKSKIFPC